jgi:hypothetical protein
MDNGVSRAVTNKRIRQESLREYLSERGSVQHLLDLIEKVEHLDPKHPDFEKDLAKFDKAISQRQKLLSKYMPDLKATEMQIEANLKATQVDMMGVHEGEDEDE